MGFGNLFIGYFLLLNITYFGITDVIAASVMLLGLYKLSSVNKYFKASSICTAVFLAFSAVEFGIFAYRMFMGDANSEILTSVIGILRNALIYALSFTAIMGMKAVAQEVEVDKLPERCTRSIICISVIYPLWMILSLPLPFIPDLILTLLSMCVIASTIIVLILNLALIYTCYMKICMPGDESFKVKPSRFAFVNEYRARKEKQAEEEQKQRIEKLKKRQKKDKNK